MFEPENQAPRNSRFKNPLLYTAIIAFAVAAYIAFVFYSRYESNRAYQERNAAKVAEERRAGDQAAIQSLGGSELAIRAFYAAPPLIHPGERAQVCYDVANAKTVAIDPPVGAVWPSHSRCLDVSPKKDTTYTLTIQDASGKSVTQSIKLGVHTAHSR